MLKLVTATLAVVIGLIILLVVAVTGAVSAVFGGGNSQPSEAALVDIPSRYLTVYRRAASTCPGLDWTILAAIGKIETNHGRSPLPGVHSGSNGAGARGPMQFLPATFAAYDQPIPPGGSNPPSPYDPVNAIYAAARYLCDSGARHRRDLYGAIFAYNHAHWYVRKVLGQAEKYRTAQASLAGPPGVWTVPTEGRCTSGYGPRPGGFHDGQDIAAPIGTPIHAAASGIVIDAGPASGYGLWVRIQHAGGVITTYGHNHRNHVQTGQHVQAGQVIAEVGNRGESTGPHLHFQIERKGSPVDPAVFYQQHSAPPLCR